MQIELSGSEPAEGGDGLDVVHQREAHVKCAQRAEKITAAIVTVPVGDVGLAGVARVGGDLAYKAYYAEDEQRHE